jgi:RHS repeat-associated protein
LVLRDSDADDDASNGLEQRLYVQQDANWNVTSLVSAGGSVVERYVYDPYDQVTRLDGSWNARSFSGYGWKFLFQAGRQDNSGLYSFRHRDYDPVMGRWIEQDPKGYVDGLNLYQAFGSNPVNRTDPLGLDSGEGGYGGQALGPGDYFGGSGGGQRGGMSVYGSDKGGGTYWPGPGGGVYVPPSPPPPNPGPGYNPNPPGSSYTPPKWEEPVCNGLAYFGYACLIAAGFTWVERGLRPPPIPPVRPQPPAPPPWIRPPRWVTPPPDNWTGPPPSNN